MPSDYPERSSSGIVLCIDDNQDVLECERACLEPCGYTVLTAPSSGKGLELASMHSVDVVILDHFMPAVNGQEVAVELRRLRPQAPIIAVSKGWDIPESALHLVDAVVAKDHLARQLLPAVTHLHPRGRIHPPAYDE